MVRVLDLDELWQTLESLDRRIENDKQIVLDMDNEQAVQHIKRMVISGFVYKLR